MLSNSSKKNRQNSEKFGLVSTDSEIVDVNVIIILAAGSHNLFIEKKASNRFELKLNSNLPGMMISIFSYSSVHSSAKSASE